MPEESPSSPVPTEPKRPMGPIRPKERIETIDILRGWALLGMLFVNMLVFSGAYRLPDLFTGTTDRVASGLIEFFAEQKFVSLFSFLFGLGFALQMGRGAWHSFPSSLFSKVVGFIAHWICEWISVIDRRGPASLRSTRVSVAFVSRVVTESHLNRGFYLCFDSYWARGRRFETPPVSSSQSASCGRNTTGGC